MVLLKILFFSRVDSDASTSQMTEEVDEKHFIDIDKCEDDPLSFPTTTRSPFPAVHPPPLPPTPPQIPAANNQHSEVIASHYGRSVDCYRRGIDAYVAHLAFLQRYLNNKKVSEPFILI